MYTAMVERCPFEVDTYASSLQGRPLSSGRVSCPRSLSLLGRLIFLKCRPLPLWGRPLHNRVDPYPSRIDPYPYRVDPCPSLVEPYPSG